jgi:hypothetical protein
MDADLIRKVDALTRSPNKGEAQAARSRLGSSESQAASRPKLERAAARPRGRQLDRPSVALRAAGFRAVEEAEPQRTSLIS